MRTGGAEIELLAYPRHEFSGMKAVVQDRYGSPEVALHLQDVDTPVVGDDRVLVRVRAASVNALDWRTVRANPFLVRLMMGMRRPKDKIRGVDVAGTVEGVGKNVTRWKPGDEVFGAAEGSFAEFATAGAGRLASKPHNLTFEQAAALPIAGFTALKALRDRGQVKPGQRVLIYGAGGGVGTFAVQIAKSLGAHVTAVTSAGKADLVRSLGADEVIDYYRIDFTRSRQRYDVLVDISGNRSLSACRRVLNPNGIMVVVGTQGLGHILKAMLWHRLVSRRVVAFVAKGGVEDLDRLKKLAEAGKLTSVIDRRYPLSRVSDALRYVETHQARGKVVIDVA